jgi:hypothetical protein
MGQVKVWGGGGQLARPEGAERVRLRVVDVEVAHHQGGERGNRKGPFGLYGARGGDARGPQVVYIGDPEGGKGKTKGVVTW